MGAGSGDLKRQGGWLPHGQDELEQWLEGRINSVGKSGVLQHPVIQESAHLIETDAVVRIYMTRMIDEVPRARQYSKRHITSVDHLLHVVDDVITTAPELDRPEPDRTKAFGERLHLRAALRQLPAGKRGVLV